MGEQKEVGSGSSWWRTLCCRVLRTGHIPKHVATATGGLPGRCVTAKSFSGWGGLEPVRGSLDALCFN